MMDSKIKHSVIENVEPLKPRNNKRKTLGKDNKLPRSAFALYIKLYCCRKDTKSSKHSSKLIEATKSWIMLSEFEKQKFQHKYKEYQQKYSDSLVSCLQKCEPFMKKKISRSQVKNLNIDVDQHSVLEDCKFESNLATSVHHENPETYDAVKQKSELIGDIEDREGNICIEEDNNILQDYSKNLYTEPTAPSLKSGKELFEIIQSNSENDVTWTALQHRERSYYNRAILTLKKDYIQKYKIYLENLTQKELFDHYNKCLKS